MSQGRPSLDQIFGSQQAAPQNRPSLDQIFSAQQPEANISAPQNSNMTSNIQKGFTPNLGQSANDLNQIPNDMQTRGAHLADIANQYQKNGGGLAQKALAAYDVAGTEAGAGLDIIGNIAKAAYHAMPDLPFISDNPKEVVHTLVNSPVGQTAIKAAQEGGQTWEDFGIKHPDVKNFVEATGNLVGAFTPVGEKTVAGVASDVGTQAVKDAAKVVAAIPNVAAEGASRLAAAALPEVSPELLPIAQKAIQYDIPISRSQLSDSDAAKTFASASGKIPFSGAKDFAKQQQSAFNREVLSTIGAEGEKVTPEIIADSYRKISDSFDSALKGQDIKVNPDAVSRLADIKSAAENKLGPEDFALVQKQIDKLSDLLTPQKNIGELLGVRNQESTIPGEKLGAIRSDLSSLSAGNGKETRFMGQLKNLVQDISVDGAPERKAQLQDSIQKFRNYQIIKPLLNKAVTGDISPNTLLGRVASNYKDFAQGGGGKLGDLARIGKAFLKEGIPDSGTAQRLMAYKALGGLGGLVTGAATVGVPAAIAGAAIPITAARGFNAVNTSQKLVKNTINRQIAKLPPAEALKILNKGKK